jgi:23S rRNA (cytidine1920-2'-O)/16S rRNA (cytidine1409-2'-O)-methyltransferase
LKEPETAPDVAAELERWLVEDMEWESLGLIPSPIDGGDGNKEFLLAGKKPEDAEPYQRRDKDDDGDDEDFDADQLDEDDDA